MKVLVACEESQAVTIELRKLGVEAYSCDLLDCSGNHLEWHIKQDVLPLLNGNCSFKTCDGVVHKIDDKWDMIITFPPCTHLAVSGARHFEQKRKDGRQQQGIDFFMKFVNCDCEHVCIENPIGIMSSIYRKPNQIIQPWMFGDKFTKSTCLWLKGLPNLKSTNIVEKGDFFEWTDKNGKKKRQAKWFFDALKNAKTNEERSIIRSKTFPGIAKAMAMQFVGYLNEVKYENN